MITVCFEGVDGAGKTTLSKKYEAFLRKEGYRVKRIKFPTWTIIKGILLNGYEIDDRAFHLLFAADFYNFQNTYLNQLSMKYDCLIFDRFWYSNIVYGLAKGIPINFLANIHRDLIHPNIVVLLDIDLDLLLKRKGDDPDIQKLNETTLLRVIENYRRLPSIIRNYISKPAQKFCILDGRGDVDSTFEKLIKLCRI